MKTLLSCHVNLSIALYTVASSMEERNTSHDITFRKINKYWYLNLLKQYRRNSLFLLPKWYHCVRCEASCMSKVSLFTTTKVLALKIVAVQCSYYNGGFGDRRTHYSLAPSEITSCLRGAQLFQPHSVWLNWSSRARRCAFLWNSFFFLVNIIMHVPADH